MLGQTARLAYRSAPAFPSALLEDAILNNGGDSRISAGKREHLLSVDQVVLRIAIFEGDTTCVIVLAGLLTVWAAWLCIDDYFQVCVSPQVLELNLISQFTKTRSRCQGNDW